MRSDGVGPPGADQRRHHAWIGQKAPVLPDAQPVSICGVSGCMIAIRWPARTACPAHRRALSEDTDFARGALGTPLPDAWDGATLGSQGRPTLVLHGSADPVTVSSDAFEPFRDAPNTRLRLVVTGPRGSTGASTTASVNL